MTSGVDDEQIENSNLIEVKFVVSRVVLVLDDTNIVNGEMVTLPLVTVRFTIADYC